MSVAKNEISPRLGILIKREKELVKNGYTWLLKHSEHHHPFCMFSHFTRDVQISNYYPVIWLSGLYFYNQVSGLT